MSSPHWTWCAGLPATYSSATYPSREQVRPSTPRRVKQRPRSRVGRRASGGTQRGEDEDARVLGDRVRLLTPDAPRTDVRELGHGRSGEDLVAGRLGRVDRRELVDANGPGDVNEDPDLRRPIPDRSDRHRLKLGHVVVRRADERRQVSRWVERQIRSPLLAQQRAADRRDRSREGKGNKRGDEHAHGGGRSGRRR